MRKFCVEWMVVLWLACMPACAATRQLAPDELPALAAGEGMLLLAVDTSVPLTAALLLGPDGTTLPVPAVPAGRSHVLLLAPQGRYRWQRADTTSTQLQLGDAPELDFRIEAGRLNYVGDLVLRPVREDLGVIVEASATLANRSLAAIDWLQGRHPRLLARYPLQYAGRYPDPFPAFYAGERATLPPAQAEGAFAAPPTAVRPAAIAMSRLMRESRFEQAHLNPGGDLLALQVREDDQKLRVVIVDLARSVATPVALGASAQDQILWAGERRLVVASGALAYRRSVRILDLQLGERGITVASTGLTHAGEVLHARGNALVVATVVDGEVQVRRLDLSRRRPDGLVDLRTGARLAADVGNALHWEADGRGMPRLARVRRGGVEYWLHGRDGQFREVLRLGDGLDVEPVALSPRGRWLYALTERGRQQRDAVAIDLETGQVARTLFSRPGVDVSSLLLDDRREPVGVAYMRQGRRVSEFFGVRGARAGHRFARLFPGQSIAFASRSQDARRWALWVEADDHRPQLRVVDVDSGRVLAVDGNAPWLEGVSMADTRLLRVPTSDGLMLDAFLTLPATGTRAPLVVMPHGGPIGIADSRGFDPRVQFLANMGYAVLRVNFRGSSGYGRAFREAGFRAQGTAIEGDIDAAIRQVTSDPTWAGRIDAGRMCLVGASYGGYSGLMAALRWPDRFRCVVSIGGVSDRLLAFTTSDSATSSQGRAQMEQVVGDPRTQSARLRETSPLYRYRELRTPVMLAHGLEDRRVDFEQSHRLARMLALAGRRPVGLVFEGEGHGLAKPDNLDRLWNGIAGFLQQELGVPAPSPVVTTAAAP